MDEFNVLDELKRLGAVYTDQHFVYKSEKHGSGYINMDPMYPYVCLMRELGERLAHNSVSNLKTAVFPEVIVGPAVGGIPLAYFTALARSMPPDILVVWADKVDESEFAFGRATFADLLVGRRILVVEDLLTTGGSVLKVCRQAEPLGAEILGVSAVCNRGGVTAEDLHVPWLKTLTEVSFEAVLAGECELCRSEVPIVTDIGHGKKFREQFPDYTGGYYELLSA